MCTGVLLAPLQGTCQIYFGNMRRRHFLLLLCSRHSHIALVCRYTFSRVINESQSSNMEAVRPRAAFNHAGVQQLLSEDASDLHHRWLKFVTIPVLLVYCGHALLSHESSLHRAGDRDGGLWLSVARDSGLRMELSSPFPPWLLRAHRLGAIALVGLTLLQVNHGTHCICGDVTHCMAGSRFSRCIHSIWNSQHSQRRP